MYVKLPAFDCAPQDTSTLLRALSGLTQVPSAENWRNRNVADKEDEKGNFFSWINIRQESQSSDLCTEALYYRGIMVLLI